MARAQTIATITQQLSSMDDEQLAAVADIVADMAAGEDGGESILPRELTPRELELIEQSKRDFAEGRTLTSEQYYAEMEVFLEQKRVKYPAAE